MDNINIINSPRGTYSCEIGVSVEEWKSILSNPAITTQNYKEALLDFYRESGHKATCKELSLKHFGNAKDAQKYNSWITQYGKAIVAHLNRFHIIDEDGKERFWHVAINPGRSLENGLFEWQLRKELVLAIESLGWNKRCSWIPFYMELADKLLAYKNNRKKLLEIVYSLDSKFTDYIKAEDGEHVSDIDPFTVFGIFNRGLSNQNRIEIVTIFKQKFDVKADLPVDFDGIPLLNNLKAVFFWRKNVNTNIQPLWDLYECVLAGDNENFTSYFNKARKQRGVRWNITMGMFWIRPYDYISLDSRNRDYLPSLGINVFKESELNSENYLKLLNEVKEKIGNKMIREVSIPEISVNAWLTDSGESVLGKEDMEENKYQQYIDLLKANKNLVLTGAPGTGKTFMAQEVAKIMAKNDSEAMMFVQFHPSYDYTDFVEGLRPIDDGTGQIGFKRKDGVFKKFCRKAAQNLVDSAKSAETLGKELSWQENLQQFVDDAIENNTKFRLTNGSEFTIVEMTGHTIKTNNEQNEKTANVVVNADEVLDLLTNEVPLNIVRDIRNYYRRKFGTQPDSYEYVIVKEIRKMKSDMTLVSAETVRKKDFVFVIDEINRGEASKIFGELFYAIDPGYRGKKDIRVQTQYQNLVPETDVFAKGFYVPENVYILGTMNDIDRSVESMDFAMRRRFTWKEVTPADTQDMLDELDASVANEAKAKMARLNDVIADADGLGAAYMIGPSYFLKLSEYKGDFDKLWNLNIEPLLKEYLRGFRKAGEVLKKFKTAYTNKTIAVETGTADIIDED